MGSAVVAAKAERKKSTAKAAADVGSEAPRLGHSAGMPRFLSSGVHELYRHRALRARLAVGPIDDPQERAADAMAEQVMTMAGGTCCAACASGQPCGSGEIRRKSQTGAPPASADVGDTASAALTRGGEPLPGGLRDFFEPRFGQQLGHVRLHTDADAAATAGSLGALAYAFGSHIGFAAGRFNPGSMEGRGLLAHELAHVTQSDAASTVRRQADPNQPAAQSPFDATAPEVLSSLAFVNEETSDEEIARQIENLNKAIESEPPNSLEAEQLRHNRRLLEEAQVARLLKNRPDADFDESGPSSVALRFKWSECATDFQESYQTLVLKTERFKSAVISSAYIRLTHNRENLEIWRKFIDSHFSSLELQHQAYAQTATDMMRTAQQHGTTPIFEQWAGESNPYMRRVEEEQIHGRYLGCTGCHLTVQAGDTESWMYDTYGKQLGRSGPAWQSPARRLGTMAGFEVPSDWSGGEKNLILIRAAIEQIRPAIEPLGEYGYRIIPEDTMSLFANATPEELKTKINENIDKRRDDYLWLQGLIASGFIKYVDLEPVLNDLLAMAPPDVARAIHDEMDEGPSIIGEVLKALIELLLMILVPPVGLIVAGAQVVAGMNKFVQGYAYMRGTGANDVFTREQQDMAGSLMAGGVLDVGLASAALVTAAPAAAEWADWNATRIITAADVKLARQLGERALANKLVTEADLLELDNPSLLTRAAHKWTDLRGYKILYRGQLQSEEILSPLARESMEASENMYEMLKARGYSDAEIAGFTARWSGKPVPSVGTPEGLAPELPLGGAGIPTTRRLNIAARYAADAARYASEGEQGIIYILRVPKKLTVIPEYVPGKMPEVGWDLQWQMETENVIFHQIPGGYVVGEYLGPELTPLTVKKGPPPVLHIPRKLQ